NGAVLSGAVTLGPGTNEPTGDNDPTANPEAGEAPNNQSNRTVDFGFYRQQLGNLVFLDDNRNGTFDAGDSPLAGATVQLYAADGVTEINVGPDGVLGTADDGPGGVTTDASGNYLFSGLPAGSYIVKVTPPAGYVSTIDTYAPADTTDPNANTDDNDNGVGTTPGQVSSNLVTLAPGDGGAASNNTVTDATGTTANPTLDFTPMVATDIIFTITITNSGPDTATGVQVTDALPAGFTFVSSSATQGTYNDATGIWDVGTLLVSQTATLTLTSTSPAPTPTTSRSPAPTRRTLTPLRATIRRTKMMMIASPSRRRRAAQAPPSRSAGATRPSPLTRTSLSARLSNTPSRSPSRPECSPTPAWWTPCKAASPSWSARALPPPARP
ncbi:MAG: hypothetical protein DCC54_12240, partial [Anaerolineae bacterium]